MTEGTQTNTSTGTPPPAGNKPRRNRKGKAKVPSAPRKPKQKGTWCAEIGSSSTLEPNVKWEPRRELSATSLKAAMREVIKVLAQEYKPVPGLKKAVHIFESRYTNLDVQLVQPAVKVVL